MTKNLINYSVRSKHRCSYNGKDSNFIQFFKRRSVLDVRKIAGMPALLYIYNETGLQATVMTLGHEQCAARGHG